MSVLHAWNRQHDDDWWRCRNCDATMHPSWTVESRTQFEAGCDLLRLHLTPPNEVVSRVVGEEPGK